MKNTKLLYQSPATYSTNDCSKMEFYVRKIHPIRHTAAANSKRFARPLLDFCDTNDLRFPYQQPLEENNMKRFIPFLLMAMLLLTGCRSETVYTHVVEDDYISKDYYLTEISPRIPGDLTPTEFGVFKKNPGGGYRLLVNLGFFTEIYGARYHTLARYDTLFLVRGQDILRYTLTAAEPQKTEEQLENFFPDTMEVIGINAVDSNYVYVYATTKVRPPVNPYPIAAFEEPDSSYTAYFAFSLDGSSYREISFDDVPIQKRY